MALPPADQTAPEYDDNDDDGGGQNGYDDQHLLERVQFLIIIEDRLILDLDLAFLFFFICF